MTQPAITEGLLTWTPASGLTPGAPAHPAGGLTPSAPATPSVGPLLVADSWLVRDGQVRALERHRERFLRACGECDGPPLRRLLEFWQDMTAALPRTGEWFPRVELGADAKELRLLIRQAP
ncbi:hypothetical protein ABZ896_12215, partial [Streptomyces sp. NPDC047072]